MLLKGIASRAPDAAFSQRDCWDILRTSRRFGELKTRSQRLLEKVLNSENGIDTRRFAMPEVEQLFDLDAESLNRGFEREAPRLGSLALGDALEAAGVRPAEVDALLVCTCTGYLCPGVSSYVAERMGMRSDVFLSDLVGLGCGAAIPMLRQADALAQANPSMTIACIAVEVCSAAFYLDDDPGVLISLCLFGDGASATVWRGGGQDPSGEISCSGFDTIHSPADRELLRFQNVGGKLKNRLDRAVPARAASMVRELHGRANCNGADIVSHAGGRDVLDEIAGVLDEPDLTVSREVLRDFGNMSRPSVLFALERYLQEKGDADFQAWATSFGAGFACHSMRIERSSSGS